MTVLTCCRGQTLVEAVGLTQRQLDGFQLGIVPQTWIIYELQMQIITLVMTNDELRVIIIIMDDK